MEVFVVAEEVLQLLKASLLSLTVLNDLFGKYCSEEKRTMPKEKGQPFFPDWQHAVLSLLTNGSASSSLCQRGCACMHQQSMLTQKSEAPVHVTKNIIETTCDCRSAA